MGCKSAHDFIKGLDLEEYYNLFQVDQIDPAPGNDSSLIEIFDDQEFQSTFVDQRGEMRLAKLFIGGLNCYACIWLIENGMRRKFPDVSVQMSLSGGLAQLEYDPTKQRLSGLVQFIRSLGFKVSPAVDHQQSNLEELIRLGVSTFCFLNVMLLAVPEYIDAELSMDRAFWQLFRWLSFGLALIVMTYGAWPHYRSALRALKLGQVHIDQSISFALLATFLYSSFNVLRGSGDVYFDSVCAIIALVGWGRYLQLRVMQSAEQSIRGVVDYAMQYVRRFPSGEVTPLASIKAGDPFIILPGDAVGVDGVVVEGDSSLSYEQLTGEPDAVDVGPDSLIRGGAVNLTARLVVKAKQDGVSSFLFKTREVIDRILMEKGESTLLADRLATGFFGIVTVVAVAILMVVWPESPEEAFRRMIAALLIACPCAFALAVPLTMARCAAIGIANGVVLKSQRAIEGMARVKQVWFDKTGTLTIGNPVVSAIHFDEKAGDRLGLDLQVTLGVVALLRSHSAHHAIHAIGDYIDKHYPQRIASQLEVANFKEETGRGVSFQAGGKNWRLGRKAFCGLVDDQIEGQKNVVLVADDRYLASFALEDELQSDARTTTAWLQERGYQLGVISGDLYENNQKIAVELGIPLTRIFAELTPEEKVAHLQKGGRNSLMVGNGFNDSLAIASAGIGVAVYGANQQAHEAADVSLRLPGLSPLTVALELSKRARRKIFGAFGFAVVFNSIGISLAAVGGMHPVVAAILMPLSSLAVLTIGGVWNR